MDKRVNKAYVRYDKNGRIIPGGPRLNRFKPKSGGWKEINAYLCCNDATTTTTTTTTTTSIIPPGAIPIPIILGYETISPVEDIVVSFTLEDACLFVNNLNNNNVNFDSFIFDETTYYFDEETFILYNSVTNTFAEDGYYLTDGILQVIDGVVQIIDPFEVCGITTTTTTTAAP
jgi:hypothetical protein